MQKDFFEIFRLIMISGVFGYYIGHHDASVKWQKTLNDTIDIFEDYSENEIDIKEE